MVKVVLFPTVGLAMKTGLMPGLNPLLLQLDGKAPYAAGYNSRTV
jgi:hypothetical protein